MVTQDTVRVDVDTASNRRIDEGRGVERGVVGMERMGGREGGGGLGIYSRCFGSDRSIEESLFFEACGVDILVDFPKNLFGNISSTFEDMYMEY